VQDLRPVWQFRLGPRTLGLVALGGTGGTALRCLITAAVPSTGFPLATFGINLAGAFTLGVLLEVLGRRPSPRAAALRLLLGTGVLGGFTTYSSLAVDTASLTGMGAAGTAALYSLGTLVLGVAAAALGIAAARARSVR
jgi:CrcB protein